MEGIEYLLHYFSYNPSLFVIHKCNRLKEGKVELLAVYYIVEGTIYQSPDLFTLLSNRVLTSLHHVQTAFSGISQESRFQPARPYHWGYEEELGKEDEWRSIKDTTMQVDGEQDGNDDDDDDGIVIEAGGLDDDNEGLDEAAGTSSDAAAAASAFMRFQPLAATSYDGARAAYEFSARLDGLIDRMRASGASWGSGGGMAAGGDTSEGSSGVAADGSLASGAKGLSLEELKAAAKARMEARAAEIQKTNAAAGFKRPEPVDRDPGGYRSVSGTPSTGGGVVGGKKKRRLQSSSSMSESVGTPEYNGPNLGVAPVQSPFSSTLSRGSSSSVSSPLVPSGRKSKK
ncbi:MED6 mediator sub complex component-domain-containing protein [Obelidium mucronatum]|nr:MED6 mediator sub complex component-domain-containing protein [Obelidium mucronatum]